MAAGGGLRPAPARLAWSGGPFPILQKLRMLLNELAARECRRLRARRHSLRIDFHETPCGARWVDCGIDSPGGIEAGLALARISLAGLAEVSLSPSSIAGQGPVVFVRTDHPVAACLAAQYAGWRLASDGFFAMGSGPMRAAAGAESLFDRIGYRETAREAVGVLETRQPPPETICRRVAEACRVAPERLTLFVAPTASLAGMVQVVARSLETALHKLLALDFDLKRVVSGWGSAPLPPMAANDLAAIGRTNDAILYGGDVTLAVRGDDRSLEQIGPLAVSSASAAHGKPFAELFELAGRDFYKIDPGLFSPARLTLHNLDTGALHCFGRFAPEVLAASWGGSRA